MKRKGVVVEIAPKNRVIILTSEGEFVRIPFKKHVHVGQEIRYIPKNARVNVLQAGLVATLFIALIGAWPLLTGRFAPSGANAAFIMTIDVNPSFELLISDQHRVLAVEGLNRDGKDLAEQLSVIGDEFPVALNKIIAQLRKAGYLGQNEKQILITIADSEHSGEGMEKGIRELKRGDIRDGIGAYRELLRVAEEVFGTIHLAQVRIWQVPPSLLNEAKMAGITPSRYLAIHLPALFAIPQRTAVRLTINDVFEYEGVASTRAGRRPAGAQPLRAALTPAQWTKQSLTSFPIVAELKGDFQLNR